MTATSLAIPSERIHWIGLFLLLIAFSGCARSSSALPIQPSPVSTLARLPSVTAIPPTSVRSPSPSPTRTLTSTPMWMAVVVIESNVRLGPGVDFRSIGVRVVGDTVIVVSQDNNWYQVIATDGMTGWMSSLVLSIDQDMVSVIPTGTPSALPSPPTVLATVTATIVE